MPPRLPPSVLVALGLIATTGCPGKKVPTDEPEVVEPTAPPPDIGPCLEVMPEPEPEPHTGPCLKMAPPDKEPVEPEPEPETTPCLSPPVKPGPPPDLGPCLSPPAPGIELEQDAHRIIEVVDPVDSLLDRGVLPNDLVDLLRGRRG
jgi:hypothetical protein